MTNTASPHPLTTAAKDAITAGFRAEITAERDRPRGEEHGHTLPDSMHNQGGIARRYARIARQSGHHGLAANLNAFADRHFGDISSIDR